MKTIKLYRPVGYKEYSLIKESAFTAFPPRLEWQPIFYPVLNFDYAAEIAEKWNTKDEFSEYVGIVTSFDISNEYFKQFNVKNVGGSKHEELWVPSEILAEFNEQIIGSIEIEKAFYGEKYKHKKIATLK
ncbi:MAG: ADP-ribosylation/crystallin J1 [Bacteroidia bacterium]